ncbi:(2Fe-2S)-binding protein [Hoeflea prorocentri]|uniref:(2Fe-2S)-binding protein n=2 Tax=Hoeflea prorocentri TaxID=1922333 RepID=A0A9X3ZG19_9HYPH|nr:(2Fe-2S)-binding protein [Hoeflea prorocentri]MDA5397166.1 (2Fe-2S)-binding protein [Hoeflea prorocentri]
MNLVHVIGGRGGLMFTRAKIADAPAVSFYFEGELMSGREGDTIAAALLLADEPVLRNSFVSHSPRAPFCMIGNCFECAVEVDGIDGVQACLTPLREGMRINRSPTQPIKAKTA